MSKWPMRGHFRYLRFKTFPMKPRTPQCEVFWALLSNSKRSGVPEDSKSPTLEVLGFTPTLGQSGVATEDAKCCVANLVKEMEEVSRELALKKRQMQCSRDRAILWYVGLGFYSSIGVYIGLFVIALFKAIGRTGFQLCVK